MEQVNLARLHLAQPRLDLSLANAADDDDIDDDDDNNELLDESQVGQTGFHSMPR